MIEAWALLLAHYSAYLARRGKRFARVAAVDASLIKHSLAWPTNRMDESERPEVGQTNRR